MLDKANYHGFYRDSQLYNDLGIILSQSNCVEAQINTTTCLLIGELNTAFSQ